MRFIRGMLLDCYIGFVAQPFNAEEFWAAVDRFNEWWPDA